MIRFFKTVLKYSFFLPFIMGKRLYEKHLIKSNPEKLMRLRYRRNMGLRLNLKDPVTLDEKINFLSFYSDTSLWSEMADKVKVREYVIKCGFPEILNEIYGVYDSFESIDFNSLPMQFVLKTNHASATNVFVKDKSKIDIPEVKKKFNKWLKMDYGLKTATPHYSRIKPRIIAEKFLKEENDMSSALTDYKIYCFHGVPRYIFVFSERIENTHEYSRMIYDHNWIPLPHFINKGLKQAPITPKPKSFEKMLIIAMALSKPFPFVRVDLYEINEYPIFSELTFTPGHNSAASPELLKLMGAEIKISNDPSF